MAGGKSGKNRGGRGDEPGGPPRSRIDAALGRNRPERPREEPFNPRRALAERREAEEREALAAEEARAERLARKAAARKAAAEEAAAKRTAAKKAAAKKRRLAAEARTAASRDGTKTAAKGRIAYAAPRKPRRKSGGGRGGDGPRRPPLRETITNLLPSTDQISVRSATYWAAVLTLWAGLGMGVLAIVWAMELPDTSRLAVPARAPSVTILASDGSVLARRGSGFAGNVNVEDLPPYVAHAFVAIEDRRFYRHAGIDPHGLARAMVANIKAMGVVQGGSTLTQQLAKNLFLQPERTLKRKVQETMLALWLESEFTKDEILSLYLNRVYFGAGAYGIEAASQRYFDKGADDLTLPESAMLAGLVKAPSRLAPTNNPEAAAARANLVLDAMRREGYLAEPDMFTAQAFPAEVVRPEAAQAGYAVDWIEDQLAGHIGRLETDITVETTIDPLLQTAAAGAIKSALAAAGPTGNVEQGALVAMTPEGAVRAIIGGRDYQESQYNRATMARRQPGSAFKPFVYLAALERGMTPASTEMDAPVTVAGYSPENFSDRYEGEVTLAHALSKSLNTVAVRVAHRVTPAAVARTAKRVGIASPLRTDLSLALGSSEVSVMELTGAYVPFANEGYGVIPYAITRITAPNEDGPNEEGGKPHVLYEREGGGLGRVVTRTNVSRMNAMLTETLISGTGRRARLDRPAAGKTGTSQDNRDAWFVGYTADLVAGVWVGNDGGASMHKVTGGTLPADIWRNFMAAAHRGLPARDLPGGLWQAPAETWVASAPIYVPPAREPVPVKDEPGFFARLFGLN